MRKVKVLLLLFIFGLFGISPGGSDPNDVRYICFGDSATHGVGGCTSKPYPTWLEQNLIERNGEQTGSVVNEGVNGDTACYEVPDPNNPGQFILIPNTRFEEVLKKYPNAHTVLYWLGVNDYLLRRTPPEQIGNCITGNLSIIPDYSNIKNVYLGTYFCPAADEWKWLCPFIGYLNADIYIIGLKNGIPVAPIYNFHLDGDNRLCDTYPEDNPPYGSPICCGEGSDVDHVPSCYAADGFHASNCGNELVAKIWYQTMFPGQLWSRQDCKQ